MAEKPCPGHGKPEKNSTAIFACLHGFRQMYGDFLDMHHIVISVDIAGQTVSGGIWYTWVCNRMVQ